MHVQEKQQGFLSRNIVFSVTLFVDMQQFDSACIFCEVLFSILLIILICQLVTVGAAKRMLQRQEIHVEWQVQEKQGDEKI